MAHTYRKGNFGVTDDTGESMSIAVAKDGLVLRAHPSAVIVKGEDLRALRDAILAMPEEAFAEPWVPGDIVIQSDTSSSCRGAWGAWTRSSTYVKVETGSWRCIGPHAVKEWRGTDDDINHMARPESALNLTIVRRNGKVLI